MKKTLYSTLLLFFVISCGGIKPVSESEYIISTSEGVMGVNMPFVITIKEGLNLSPAQLRGAITISPKMEFSDTLLNGVVFKIMPKNRLEYNKAYKVSVDLDKISAGKEKGIYSFNVSTQNPDYNFTTSALQTIDVGEGYVLVGDVESSDYVDDNYIEKNLKVSGTAAVVQWTHAAGGMLHSYRIEPIKPKESSYDVTLNFDYHKKNVSSATVPALGEYRIMDCRVSVEPLSVEVAFSHNLNPVQRFEELINLPIAFRTRVDGNRLIIYLSEPFSGKATLQLYSGIESVSGDKLSNNTYAFELIFPEDKPSIRFLSSGSILPTSNDMKLLFESVNYAKARVRVRKIYANNLLQFFQYNDYAGNGNLEYVSAFVKDTTFNLDIPGSFKLRARNNYALDLSPFISSDNRAIFRIEIKGIDPLVEVERNDWDDDENGYMNQYYLGDYRTYSARSRNILQSDLGIIAKGYDNSNLIIYTTNIITAMPYGSSSVSVYNKVNQLVGRGVTDSYGRAVLQLTGEAHVVVAENGASRSLLKVGNGESLSISNFDVAGTNTKGGIKGYIFGERGVWRPGDDIYITFMVTSAGLTLPADHPTELTLRNPSGHVIKTVVQSKSSGGIYNFKLKTAADAPTGNWTAEVKYGGETFTKNIKIETIKPNRMRINFTLNDTPLLPANDIIAKVNAKWLHGSAAADLRVKIIAKVSDSKTMFKGYEKYTFDNESRSMESEERELLLGVTDSNGNVTMRGDLSGLPAVASGVVNAKFSVKVFEKSGDFSIDEYVTKISPYDTYVGSSVDMQTTFWGDKYLSCGKRHDFYFVTLDNGGKLKSTARLKVEIYKMESSWWWGASSANTVASYLSNSYNRPYKTEIITVQNGKASMPLQWSESDSGYYIIKATDEVGGHASTLMCYVGDSYMSGDGDKENNAATRLAISCDKDKYSTGESAKLNIPTPKGARALVSIESGSRVVESYWVDCTPNTTTIPVSIKAGMAPNVYAYITTLQPHNNTLNDLPIRMYGVVRLRVEDKDTKLTPVIKTGDSVRPETEFTLTVSEQNGKAMSYVVAIVDEGLLDITRFKTPDPYGYFNANESLGVRTWDLFDQVIGAYGGRIEQLFAIGGDDEVLSAGRIKAERFKPVVHFIEVQSVAAGKSNSHKIKLPPYFGSVRVMVIASNGKAQGAVDKRVEVKKPLLAQLTMPRVVSTGEEIVVPVTLFAMENNIGNVTVELNCNERFTVVGSKTQNITINKAGEELLFFRLKVTNNSGIGKVTASARGGDDQSVSAVEIDVRNPNPTITQTKTVIVKAGQSITVEGFKAGESSKVELSSLPPIDLSRRLKYLTDYPHGCVEQIVSGAFPQLYINSVLNCPVEMLDKMQFNVKTTLDRLNSYQIDSGNGGLSYWSGGANVSEWGTIYATHFMVEAAKKGYEVNQQLKKGCFDYLRKTNFKDDIDAAYSLYVLSLSGGADRGAMNRLKERKNLSIDAQWLLAGAFALDGKSSVAHEMIKTISVSDGDAISSFSTSFNSAERRQAVALSVMNAIGEREEGFKLVTKLSESLKSSKYMSTQSIAWSLNTISQYVSASQKASSTGVNVTLGEKIIKTDKSVSEVTISKAETLTNGSSGDLFVVVSTTYVPEKGSERELANGLRLNVRYYDLKGTSINPLLVSAGTEFFAEVVVKNSNSYQDYTNLALTHIVPAGWEIANSRLNGDEAVSVDNQDIRDDRVLSYFNLNRGMEKRVRIKVTATYKGRYYLPAISCEAMYDGTISASTKGVWVEVK